MDLLEDAIAELKRARASAYATLVKTCWVQAVGVQRHPDRLECTICIERVHGLKNYRELHMSRGHVVSANFAEHDQPLRDFTARFLLNAHESYVSLAEIKILKERFVAPVTLVFTHCTGEVACELQGARGVGASQTAAFDALRRALATS